MFQSVRIKNYKCFSDLRLDDLRRIVLVGGDNNVGKTNLLEALFLYHNRQNPVMLTSHWGWRGIPRIPNDTEHFVAPIFRDFDTSREISIEVRRVNAEPEVVFFALSEQKSADVVDFEPTTTPGGGSEIGEVTQPSSPVPEAIDIRIRYERAEYKGTLSFSMNRQGAVQGSLRFDRTVPIPEKTFMLACRGGMSPNEESERFADLDRQNRVPELVESMQILAPGLRDLSVIPMAGSNVIHCDIGRGRKIPLRLLGDGVVRFFQFSLGMMYARGSVALFDEVDSGLHHSIKSKVFRSLADSARREDCQLFCTTHSYECVEKAVEGLANGFEDDFCYIRLDKVHDRVVPKYYAYDALAAAIENQWEVR